MANTLEGSKIRIVEAYEFTIHSCLTCGTPIALDKDYERQRRDDHAIWYCPNGHGQAWPQETEAERLRKVVARRDAEIVRKSAELDGALDRMRTVERSRAAVQGELTKVKNRVRAGVCPECNRTFQRLTDHMRSKHGTPGDAADVAHEHGAA